LGCYQEYEYWQSISEWLEQGYGLRWNAAELRFVILKSVTTLMRIDGKDKSLPSMRCLSCSTAGLAIFRLIIWV